MRKLDEIVREFYIESLGASQMDERFPRFLTIAISGLRDLNNDIKRSINTIVIPVNENKTVDLPSDYIDYQVIGEIRNGTIRTLGKNENQAPLGYDDCGNSVVRPSEDASNDQSGIFIDYNSTAFSQDGQFVGRRYGFGGGGNSLGTYNIYRDLGYIALNNFDGDEVVLRYLSNLKKVNGSFVVEEFMIESLKAWMWWKYIQRTRSYTLAEKKDAEMTYYREKRKSQIRVSRFNIPEFLNAYNSGFRSSPQM